MQPNDYQKLAARTECDNREVIKRKILYDSGAEEDVNELLATRLTHAAFGLSTETGELTDALKKWLYYGQELDISNLKEELGDILWYIALACNALGVDLSQVMESNIDKLRKRYPEKYTDKQAIEENRDREAERGVITKQKDAIASVDSHQDEAERSTIDGRDPRYQCPKNYER